MVSTSGPVPGQPRAVRVQPRVNMGVGQNETTRGPQVLVLGSIYQGFILGTYF